MKYRVKFITPCFCAGADQKVAEVRAPSIRAELRWWFRALGGTREDEETVFGAVAGYGGRSSAVFVRVSNLERSAKLYEPSFVSPNDPGAYLHYLLTAPNDKEITRMWETPPNAETKKKGRIRETSQIPPESMFDLEISLRRRIGKGPALDNFSEARNCFLRFGSIGYRKTRGFGSFMVEESVESRAELEGWIEQLKPKNFSFEISSSGSSDPLAALRQVETKLKGNKEAQTGLRLHHPAKTPSPLGYSDGPGRRQSSAVRFRPVPFKTKSGDLQYSLLIFQAPDSVLGDAVKTAYRGRTRLIPA